MCGLLGWQHSNTHAGLMPNGKPWPVEAEAIARRAQALAARLHAWDAACFWWQLLTALAPLEAFEPRRGAGFRKLEST